MLHYQSSSLKSLKANKGTSTIAPAKRYAGYVPAEDLFSDSEEPEDPD